MLCGMAHVTQLLAAAEAGDPTAAAELLPLVYAQLRQLASARMAAEASGHTLTATALVHEAYLRLVGGDGPRSWDGRGHFFAAAAEAMRRILINRAREKGRLKRGGGQRRVDLDGLSDAATAPADDLLDLDAALDRLAVAYPECARLVQLRFFAGLTLDEAAAALGLARRSADRQWAFARAWLADALGGI
jgi:RNA polymerase sigma factor (TIGR02999 family)